MKKSFLLGFILLISGSILQGQIVIELRKSFIDSIKNTVTLSSEYAIDKAHERPNSPSKDGDMHVAGRDLKVGLPVVAEIMNAKKERDAVALVHQKEGSGETVDLTGVWRFWCEHATSNEEEFIQGTVYDPFDSSNPPHVFEFHPVTRLEEFDLVNSLKPIKGYEYKDPDMAFSRFANVRFQIEPQGDVVRMTTNGIGFNYIRFKLELNDDHPLMVDDGAFAFAKLLNDENHVICYKVRTVFVKNSVPYNTLLMMKKGDVIEVVGIPRINMALVGWRVENSVSRPEALTWNLPYELVIVAVL
jgi:hypothetical protein